MPIGFRVKGFRLQVECFSSVARGAFSGFCDRFLEFLGVHRSWLDFMGSRVFQGFKVVICLLLVRLRINKRCITVR